MKSSVSWPNRPSKDRFFCLAATGGDSDPLWYYRAREGTIGPFISRSDAEIHYRSARTDENSRLWEGFKNLWLLLKRI
jgi:hypothetical protein